MQAAFNVIIDRDYLGPGLATIATVGDRDAALKLLADDLKAFKGDKSQWRGFIEEVYVAGEKELDEEKLRIEWHRASLAEDRRLLDEVPTYRVPKVPPTVPLLVCKGCGFELPISPGLPPYPGYHWNRQTASRCDHPLDVVEATVTVHDPYGNPVTDEKGKV
jgi:hypothetical protein